MKISAFPVKRPMCLKKKKSGKYFHSCIKLNSCFNFKNILHTYFYLLVLGFLSYLYVSLCFASNHRDKFLACENLFVRKIQWHLVQLLFANYRGHELPCLESYLFGLLWATCRFKLVDLQRQKMIQKNKNCRHTGSLKKQIFQIYSQLLKSPFHFIV